MPIIFCLFHVYFPNIIQHRKDRFQRFGSIPIDSSNMFDIRTPQELNIDFNVKKFRFTDCLYLDETADISYHSDMMMLINNGY